MGDRVDAARGACATIQEPVAAPLMRHSQSREEAVVRNKSILSPKHCMNFATWSVHTLNDCGKGIKAVKEID